MSDQDKRNAAIIIGTVGGFMIGGPQGAQIGFLAGQGVGQAAWPLINRQKGPALPGVVVTAEVFDDYEAPNSSRGAA